AGAGGPGAAVDPALERRRALTRAEGEVGGGGVARVAGLGGDRGVRRGGVDRPGVGRGGCVRVACGVGRAHLEGVRAVAETGVALRGAAGRPAAAVELALEGRAAFARVEGE